MLTQMPSDDSDEDFRDFCLDEDDFCYLHINNINNINNTNASESVFGEVDDEAFLKACNGPQANLLIASETSLPETPIDSRPNSPDVSFEDNISSHSPPISKLTIKRNQQLIQSSSKNVYLEKLAMINLTVFQLLNQITQMDSSFDFEQNDKLFKARDAFANHQKKLNDIEKKHLAANQIPIQSAERTRLQKQCSGQEKRARNAIIEHGEQYLEALRAVLTSIDSRSKTRPKR